jgi:hypothetical protein
MKEFNKAKKQLKDYQEGVRKSPPGKAALNILESQGVISKIENELTGSGNTGGKLVESRRQRSGPDMQTIHYGKESTLPPMVTKNIKRQLTQ